MNRYCVRIPRKLIYDTEIDNKRMSVFLYFYINNTLSNRVTFSINYLCRWIGYVPNSHIGKINGKIIRTLQCLIEKGYFTNTEHTASVLDKIAKHNNIVHLNPNANMFRPNNNFAFIYEEELEKIFNFKNIINNEIVIVGSVSVELLLLVLSYIRVNSSNKRCCYRYLTTIEADLGVNRNTIAKAINILRELDIITFKEYTPVPARGGLKFFADTKKYEKSDDGEFIPDSSYNAAIFLNEQIKLYGQKKIK